MKKWIGFLIILTAFFFNFAANAADSYKIDPNHSYVQWLISHFNFSHPSGKWMISEGQLSLDKEKPENSKVNVLIHTNEIVTGIPELDKHLKGALFFDVEKYPEATFVSDKVTLTGKNSADVHGMLTVRGITKPIILKVTLNKIGISPITNKETVG